MPDLEALKWYLLLADIALALVAVMLAVIGIGLGIAAFVKWKSIQAGGGKSGAASGGKAR